MYTRLLARTFAEVPTSAMGVFYTGTAAAPASGTSLFESWVWPTDPAGWAAILGLGLLPIGLGVIPLGLRRSSAGDIQALGAFSYVEPFLGAAWSPCSPRGELGWTLLVAGVLIVGGAALAARSAWA